MLVGVDGVSLDVVGRHHHNVVVVERHVMRLRLRMLGVAGSALRLFVIGRRSVVVLLVVVLVVGRRGRVRVCRVPDVGQAEAGVEAVEEQQWEVDVGDQQPRQRCVVVDHRLQ